jgi:hypothetical protein
MKSRRARKKPFIEDRIPEEIAGGLCFFIYGVGGMTAFFPAIVYSANEALDELRSRFKEGHAEAYVEVIDDHKIVAVITPYEFERKVVFRWVKP